VVFDTMVFVRALLNSRGLPARLIFAYHDRYRLFLSPPVVEEILEVLGREELIARFNLRQIDYGAALAQLLASFQRAETVEIPDVPAVSRDPKDDKFLATAQAAQADYLVSEDQDLLVLNSYQGTRIIDSATFLRLLEQSGQPE
jgi:putative PIN family toxin of toxin-antitoxin system